jgi:hypothetical protein
MEHFKYYVVVEDPVFKEAVSAELKSQDGTDHIPDRSVDCHDEMEYSEYNSIFLLTTEEAEVLKNDPRVRDVHRIPAELGIFPKKCGVRTGVFERANTAPTTTARNWGLIRSISTFNSYGTSTTTSSSYTYNLDGTGVDVIVMDTGVEPYHPEFSVNADGSGGTRVVNHDWTQYGYLSTPTGGFLGDCDGHGSNVASIIAGNTCGWAPGAKIYSLRVVGNTYTTERDITDGRVLGLVNEHLAWASIIAFHNAKSVDPATGYKRPTVVNCSYGYPSTYNNLKSITYRGSTTLTTATIGTYGTIGSNVDPYYGGNHGYRYSAIDADISSVLAAGVIIVGAAGNDTHKIDVLNGLDYNNYWTDTSNSSYYYHRGATPGATSGVICVGCISYAVPEHRRSFSCAGPRIDVWAPGDQILGAFTNSVYSYAAIVDPRSSVSTSSGASYYLQKISGTSQASPQVAGVVSCLLQARPWMTPAQVRSWTTATASVANLDETYYGMTGTYTNWAGLMGAPQKLLYQPFNQDITMSVSHLGTSTVAYPSFSTFLSSTISTSVTAAQLGNRKEGLNTGSTGTTLGIHSTWTFSGTNITMLASGIPYHSYFNAAAANIPYVQNYNKTWTYRGGTNVAGSNTPTGGGYIGFWLNGIAMFNPSAQGGAPGGYTTFANWHYNAAYEAGETYGYSFGEDSGGGHAAPNGVGNGTYHYHDGSMIITGAWVTGNGHTSGVYGATGIAECNVIPYLNGGLTHFNGHSKIMGVTADGYPIYGPYGYSTATDPNSGVRRMVPGYALNPTFVANNARTTNGTTPAVNSQYPLGIFVEDWSYVGGGDLDTHNGRYCVTPEYPNGTYAYFLAFDADLKPTYPYVVGNTYYGVPATL